MSSARIPSSSPTPSHLRQIDAKLASELMQHAAANERHDDGEKHLVRVALGVVHQVAPQLAQLAVQRLQVAVARRARVTRCGGAVAAAVAGAGAAARVVFRAPGGGVGGARWRGGEGVPAHCCGVGVGLS